MINVIDKRAAVLSIGTAVQGIYLWDTTGYNWMNKEYWVNLGMTLLMLCYAIAAYSPKNTPKEA